MFEYIALAFAGGVAALAVGLYAHSPSGITRDAEGNIFRRVIKRNEEGQVISSEEVHLNPKPAPEAPASETPTSTEAPAQ